MKIKPMNKHLLVRKPGDGGLSQGGIILAPASEENEKLVKGEVVDVSDDLRESATSYWVPIRQGGGNSSIDTVSDDDVPVFRIDVGSIAPKDVEEYIAKVKEQMNPRPKYEIGETIVFSVYGKEEIRHEGETFYIVPDKEVRARVTK